MAALELASELFASNGAIGVTADTAVGGDVGGDVGGEGAGALDQFREQWQAELVGIGNPSGSESAANVGDASDSEIVGPAVRTPPRRSCAGAEAGCAGCSGCADPSAAALAQNVTTALSFGHDVTAGSLRRFVTLLWRRESVNDADFKRTLYLRVEGELGARGALRKKWSGSRTCSIPTFALFNNTWQECGLVPERADLARV
jgi:hypothetical protein